MTSGSPITSGEIQQVITSFGEIQQVITSFPPSTKPVVLFGVPHSSHWASGKNWVEGFNNQGRGGNPPLNANLQRDCCTSFFIPTTPLPL